MLKDVESMASHRPYRPALGIEAALEEIEKYRGTFYDNAVADACLRLFREKGFQLEAINNRSINIYFFFSCRTSMNASMRVSI